MAGKKATSKTTRGASPKKAPAKSAKAARRKTRGKSSAKRSAKAAAKRTTKGTSKKSTKKARRKTGVKSAPAAARKSPGPTTDHAEAPAAETTRPSPAPAGPPPSVTGNPARGERALLGRGPWWWRESLTKTTPEAPDAASYRRGRADEPEIAAVPLKPTPSPIDLDALMPGTAQDDAGRPTDTGRDEPDLLGPPAPGDVPGPAPAEEPSPDSESTQPPDPLQALAALVIREIPQAVESLQVLEGEEMTGSPEKPVSSEALDTLPPNDSEMLDEVIEALKVLEGTDPPPTIEPLEGHEAASVEDDAASDEATAPAPEVAGLDTAQDDPCETELEPHEPTASEPEAGIVEASVPDSVTEPTAQEADEPRTIEQLDDEVSGNLDRLLHGEFESVDELLEGEFDEPAPVRDDSANAEDAPEPPEAVATSSETEVGSEIAVADRVDELHDEPQVPPTPERVPDPAGSADVDGSRRRPERAAAAARDEADEWGPTVAGKPRRTATAAPADPGAESSMTASLIALLQWANTPRRRLSPAARLIVDWVALSLLFWVPVVWVFALVVAG